jgi:hypothetical protein
MTHPDEFYQIVDPLKTPEDILAEALGLDEIINPDFRPVPVIKWQPEGEIPF